MELSRDCQRSRCVYFVLGSSTSLPRERRFTPKPDIDSIPHHTAHILTILPSSNNTQRLPSTSFKLIAHRQISVILGTNQDEFALFLAAIDLVIPGAKLPFGDQGMDLVTQHLIQYHDHWNETTSNQVIREYDPALFKTQSSRITTAGTGKDMLLTHLLWYA